MYDNYILLIVQDLRNIISYINNEDFANDHNITLSDLDELDYYLYKLEKSLT